MKQLKDLMAAATHRRFSSEPMVDEWLDAQHISDPTLRIAAKHAFEASGKFTPGHQMRANLATDAVLSLGTLATARARQTPSASPVGAELRALLKKARLNIQESYAEATVDDALDRAGLGITERIATKHCLAEHGCLRR
jgi:hypothetical protein